MHFDVRSFEFALALTLVVSVIFFAISRYGRNAKKMTTAAGVEYLWSYRPRSRNSPPLGAVGIEVSTPFDFSFETEGRRHRWAKSMGFASEYQTGDAEFDDRIFIDCDNREFCESLRTNAEMRKVILRLMNNSIQSIRASGGKLMAELKYTPNPKLDDETASAYVEDLSIIKRRLPATIMNEQMMGGPTGPSERMAGPGALNLVKPFKSLLYTMGFLAVLATLYDCFQPGFIVLGHDKMEIFQLAFGLSVTISLAFIGAIAGCFRGSVRGYDALMLFLGIGVGSIFALCFALIYTINMQLDGSAANVIHQRITSRWITTGSKGSKNYHIKCVDWHNPGDFYSMNVNSATYYSNSGLMTFYIHPGNLGLEWSEKYEASY